jgi:protease-4
MTAIACDYLIAHQGTLTGSIGVLSQSFEVTDMAHKLGIKFNSFKSSPLKGGPMPTEELTPEMRAAMNETIIDIYKMFFDMVAERRSSISKEDLVHIADGRVYTGRQAVENGLVDAIGDEDTAVEWIKSVKKVDSGLKVRDIELEPQQSKWRKILDSSARVLIFLENSIKGGLFSFL